MLPAAFQARALETEPHIEDAFRTGSFDNSEMPGKKRYLVLFKRHIQECFLQGMNLADTELQALRARFDQ